MYIFHINEFWINAFLEIYWLVQWWYSDTLSVLTCSAMSLLWKNWMGMTSWLSIKYFSWSAQPSSTCHLPNMQVFAQGSWLFLCLKTPHNAQTLLWLQSLLLSMWRLCLLCCPLGKLGREKIFPWESVRLQLGYAWALLYLRAFENISVMLQFLISFSCVTVVLRNTLQHFPAKTFINSEPPRSCLCARPYVDLTVTMQWHFGS